MYRCSCNAKLHIYIYIYILQDFPYDNRRRESTHSAPGTVIGTVIDECGRLTSRPGLRETTSEYIPTI